MKTLAKWLPVLVVCAAVFGLAAMARPRSIGDDGFNLVEFGRLPVQENGRIMPLDTFARAKLMAVSNRQEIRQEVFTKAEKAALVKERHMNLQEDMPAGGLTAAEKRIVDEIDAKRAAGSLETRVVPATEWALTLMSVGESRGGGVGTPTEAMHDMHMFRIDSDELLQFLELKPSRQFGMYYRLEDFLFKDDGKFMKEVKKIMDAGGPQKDDVFANKIIDLYQKVAVVERIAKLDVPFLLPPKVDARQGEDVTEEKWLSVASAARDPESRDNAIGMIKILMAYGQGNAAAFNEAVKQRADELQTKYPGVIAKTGWEVLFNRLAPYNLSAAYFVGVLALTILSWFALQYSAEWSTSLRHSAIALGALTMVVYTIALVLRIYISGYAPVTNLYSSAVFIGWGSALLCLGLELYLRNGIGLAVASVAAIISNIIAHNLFEGDSMGKLVAVLESNFWLSTHVICITFGYVATIVAGFFGVAYGVITMMETANREPASTTRNEVGKAVYGVICFALFLSFVGTVLGGIWADQSWGRFWGWDPKENGALLLVLWNAIILHARWAGMARSLGVAMLSVFGIFVTSWSWFGTNLLGVGLHSYGFTSGGMIGILAVLFLSIGFIVTCYCVTHFAGAKVPAAKPT
jgi:ABC-type transport system involved in cytochrome c biogenesis permease subunit